MNSARASISSQNPFVPGGISAPVLPDPSQPHDFSKILRWVERKDGTFALEFSGLGSDTWKEVALWKNEAPKPVDFPNIAPLKP